MKATLIVAGIAMLGYLLPELLAAFGKVRVPQMMNWWAAVACGLIAAGFFAV
jgi:hypothetical protein